MDKQPILATAEMGYGHLRAAHALSEALGVPMTLVDRSPLAQPDEVRIWDLVRALHGLSSRGSSLPVVGAPIRTILEMVTTIPSLHPYRDLAAPSLATRLIDRLVTRGVGQRLVESVHATRAPLLSTFFVPALAADRAGVSDNFCVVTDADASRAWVARDPHASGVRYLAPSGRVVRRLRAFGVPKGNIRFTGFPLPPALLGGPSLSALIENLGPPIVRLDPKRRFRAHCCDEEVELLSARGKAHEGRPPLLACAVGGAGAQSGLVSEMLPGLKRSIVDGSIRLALIAGTRPEVAMQFSHALAAVGLVPGLHAVEVLFERDVSEYFNAFNRLMARTDILWTKPSELTFFAALGLPLILAEPVGVHERFNRRYAREQGVGLKMRNARHLATRLEEWVSDGTLAAAAWSGYRRLPKDGTYRILERLANDAG